MTITAHIQVSTSRPQSESMTEIHERLRRGVGCLIAMCFAKEPGYTKFFRQCGHISSPIAPAAAIPSRVSTRCRFLSMAKSVIERLALPVHKRAQSMRPVVRRKYLSGSATTDSTTPHIQRTHADTSHIIPSFLSG